mgnify:FL=1
MKKYLVTNKKTQEICGKFDSKSEAADEMLGFIEEHNEDVDSDDEEYLTPFDFTLEEIESKEINEVVTDYEKAREYLGGKPNADFTVAKKILSGNCVQLEDVTRLVSELNPKHVKAIIAFNRLCAIAQAWNKEDDFTPDFSNRNQEKWFPWFVYSDDAAGFVYAGTYYTATNANANYSSLLYFARYIKTKCDMGWTVPLGKR